MSKISLNQIGVLRSVLKDNVYHEHMDNFDLSNLEQVMARLSEKQYKYILYLICAKRWITAKNILAQNGLKNKEVNNIPFN